MNILEAYEKLKQGEIIRVDKEDCGTYYVVLVNLKPFSEIRLYKLDADSCSSDEMPMTLDDLDRNQIDEFPVDLLAYDGFTEITAEEAIATAQEFWKNGNNDHDDD